MSTHTPPDQEVIPSLTSTDATQQVASDLVNSNSVASHPKRPYQRPGFVVSQAFERQALSCAGCLNQSASFPNFCAMRS